MGPIEGSVSWDMTFIRIPFLSVLSEPHGVCVCVCVSLLLGCHEVSSFLSSCSSAMLFLPYFRPKSYGASRLWTETSGTVPEVTLPLLSWPYQVFSHSNRKLTDRFSLTCLVLSTLGRHLLIGWRFLSTGFSQTNVGSGKVGQWVTLLDELNPEFRFSS